MQKGKQDILDNILNDLKSIETIRAIVLGGSYATQTATEASDLDIGIYYSDKMPFDIEHIKSVAKKYAMDGTPTVTGIYEWGPWVNGGAWIQTTCGKVDFLYRSIEHVSSTIEKAQNGKWENDYEQQPPYGFSSIIYLAETQCCIPLYDPDRIIEKLKTEVVNYPKKLKVAIVQQSIWAAEFTIWHADYFFKKQDIYNLLGCLTRAVKSIVTAIFAINELYPMGDKRAIECLEKARIKPENFKGKIEMILCADKATIDSNISVLRNLFDETVKLTRGTYEPFYKL